MPTIVEEGQFRFVIYPKENVFEPPHVHVWVGNENVCRIELNSGRFMDNPPPGEYRNIIEVYKKHVEAIWQGWERIHGG